MYSATEESNVKWGGTDFKGGPDTTGAPTGDGPDVGPSPQVHPSTRAPLLRSFLELTLFFPVLRRALSQLSLKVLWKVRPSKFS